MTDHKALLKLLFATFPPPPGDNVQSQLEAYAIALEGHDLRDIEAAVRALIRGEVAAHNQSFSPSAALLGNVVIGCRNARLDRESRGVVRNQLPAPTVERTDESRAMVAAMMRQAVADLTVAGEDDEEATRRRQATQSRMFDRFDPPQSEAEMLSRLRYTTGDSDEDGDWGGREAV